jgi:phosphomannomutase
MLPVYLGALPTPALTAHAIAHAKGSIMVTGSHIPFDRNGYKTNTSQGELLKRHEPPINDRVALVRERVYSDAFVDSPFAENGQLKSGHRALPAIDGSASTAYVQRYVDFLGAGALSGLRVVFYQHSAVGRDLVPMILRELGAEVIEAGRSEQFVPIDTENIDAEQLAAMQSLIDDAAQTDGRIDALVSTDGDSDRPLILGVDPESGRAQFLGGDLVGMMTAEFLGADAVVVPISCNDAIDRGRLKPYLEPKTRIGSPFVIAGMEVALAKGKSAVCGWEANGGFLTGSVIRRHDRTLAALPTRDAVLPMVAVLTSAKEQGLSLVDLFKRLPQRFSRAALIKDFPREKSLNMLRRFSPTDPAVCEIDFTEVPPHWRSADGETLHPSADSAENMQVARQALSIHFREARGFGTIDRINFLDGIRISFANGDIAHLRPSGNADELRIYAVADTQDRADAITAMAVAEPDGILRVMSRETEALSL